MSRGKGPRANRHHRRPRLIVSAYRKLLPLLSDMAASYTLTMLHFFDNCVESTVDTSCLYGANVYPRLGKRICQILRYNREQRSK